MGDAGKTNSLIPEIRNDKGTPTLYVKGEPFFVLSGDPQFQCKQLWNIWKSMCGNRLRECI